MSDLKDQMELVFSINYRVLSTINIFSTNDHRRFCREAMKRSTTQSFVCALM